MAPLVNVSRSEVACAGLSTSGTPVPAVSRPRKLSVAMGASLPSVTAPASIVQTPPVTVTSPLSPSPTLPRTCVAPPLRSFTSPLVVFSHSVPSAGLTGSLACPPRCTGFGKVTSPVPASASSATDQPVPSALTLTAKSSDPAVPISARPENPVWNNRLAVSPPVALFSFS